MNIDLFMSNGLMDAAGVIGKFYAGNRKGQAFVVRTVSALRRSAKRRERHEAQGIHIPPYLIASIAASCNLRCTGCYARANGGCSDDKKTEEMNAGEWLHVFQQANDAGVSIVMLAGGEPLLRQDVIALAAQFPDMVFPIFTNGTMIDDQYLSLFDKHRNLIPILSIEGDDAQTDTRRGAGTAAQVWQAEKRLKEEGILFGTSITVTSENMRDVTEPQFIRSIAHHGCGLMFFIEYVPAAENTEELMLSGEALRELQERIDALRKDKALRNMSFVSFPGDEAEMGGCLAAGRGFFHVNANGGAEPCPFSPFSEMNLKTDPFLDVLQSPFFAKVREISVAEALHHEGGCTLFQHKDDVLGMMAQ